MQDGLCHEHCLKMDRILVQTLLMLLLPHLRGEDNMGEILNISDAEFDATISNNQFVLVDFWAPWCGPCKMIGPILDQISSERDDVQMRSQAALQELPEKVRTVFVLNRLKGFGYREIIEMGDISIKTVESHSL